MVIELCCSENSQLGITASEYQDVVVIRITKNEDILNPQTQKMLFELVKKYPGIHLHASLPCTVWTSWQNMCMHIYGEKYIKELHERREESVRMVSFFIELATLVMDMGGHISFEWPRRCAGWMIEELVEFIHSAGLYTALADGCAYTIQRCE